MYKILLFCLISLSVHKINGQYVPGQCSQAVHAGCTAPYLPTPLEVDRARLYIQNKYMTESVIRPTLPACPRLYVRRNFKCMTHLERMRVINVLQVLYANGFMWNLAQIHSKCWIIWHKSVEGPSAHRWLMNKLELEMIKIDPGVTLPYWITSEDCVNPQESLIWQYFGTTGTNATNYCVPDGPFTGQTGNRCIKRQWGNDGTIKPWTCPELEQFYMNLGSNLLIVFFFTLGQHFHQHLNMGGWSGHYSESWAPYDFVFYLHHGYYSDCFLAKWQLSNPAFLTPMSSYNTGWKFDPLTRQPMPANISLDTMCHYNTPVVDSWHLGFGDMCFVCDQVVLSINNLLNNITVSDRALHRRVSRKIYSSRVGHKYGRSLTPMNTMFTEPALDSSVCNPQCYPMPYPPSYTSDANNRRQLDRMVTDWGINLGAPMQLADIIIKLLITMFNQLGFCSAYVTAPTNSLGSIMGPVNPGLGSLSNKKSHKKSKKSHKKQYNSRKNNFLDIVDALMKNYTSYFDNLVKFN